MFISSSCLHFTFIGVSELAEQTEILVACEEPWWKPDPQCCWLTPSSSQEGKKTFHIKLQTHWLSYSCAICMENQQGK